ncbi:MAG: response regulator [Acidobacteriota bacterium]
MATRILVVEDSIDSRDLLVYLLEVEGFEVLSAENGKIAIELAVVDKPDLIITDIQMPVIDGIEMIKRLRAQPDLKHTPIVVMTAFLTGMVSQALEVGANAAIQKPLQIEKLTQMIREMLS